MQKVGSICEMLSTAKLLCLALRRWPVSVCPPPPPVQKVGSVCEMLSTAKLLCLALWLQEVASVCVPPPPSRTKQTVSVCPPPVQKVGSICEMLSTAKLLCLALWPQEVASVDQLRLLIVLKMLKSPHFNARMNALKEVRGGVCTSEGTLVQQIVSGGGVGLLFLTPTGWGTPWINRRPDCRNVCLRLFFL